MHQYLQEIQSLKQLNVVSQIGKGAFATVYKVQYYDEYYALKQIDLEQSAKELQEAQKEILILTSLQNDHIVQYYYSFVDNGRLNIIMELAECSLKDIIDLQRLSERQMVYVVKQVLDGLKYLHSQNIVHRDIKPANILLDSNFHVKLCDFGISGVITETMKRRFSSVGTPYYSAPEQVTQRGTTFSADIYSLGVVIMELLTQQIPYKDMDVGRLIQLIKDNKVDIIKEFSKIYPRMSRPLRDFLFYLVNNNPNKRWTAEQLLRHKYVVLNEASITDLALLEVLEKARTGLQLQHKLIRSINQVVQSQQGVVWDFSDIKSNESRDEPKSRDTGRYSAALMTALTAAGIVVQGQPTEEQARRAIELLLGSSVNVEGK